MKEENKHEYGDSDIQVLEGYYRFLYWSWQKS